ncbi:adenylosuccinate lyase [candidate division KSB1 bacterium]
MIPRYTRPRMGAVWTDENKYRKWLEVELAVVRAQAQLGRIPQQEADLILKKADFDAARVDEIEAIVHHDVIAFLTAVAENVGPASRYIHLGMTSSDILDTGLSLQLKEAGGLLLEGLDSLIAASGDLAARHRRTAMIGRSHGVHAEPITFGFKMAVFYQEFLRAKTRLLSGLEEVSFGKVSGAVGTFAHMDPKVEAMVCAELGLKPAPVSTQIVQRDRHAGFLTALALLGCSLEKLALEVRGLTRTEVKEVEEFFASGQKGSSAMPHKRNPIISERVCGLARVLRGNAIVAMENVALWHERDISHSGAERVIFPDSCILADYMLAKTTHMVENLQVYPENMEHNLWMTGGLVFSQPLLLELAVKGMTREDAYAAVQQAAMRVQDRLTAGEEAGSFRDEVARHPEIKKFLTPQEIDKLFDLEFNLRHVPEVLDRAGIPSDNPEEAG